jgi:hypothetical protein
MPVSLLEHQHEDRGEDQDAKFAIRRGAERCGLGTHELAVGDRSRPVSGPNRSRRGLGSATEVRIPGPELVTAGRPGHVATLIRVLRYRSGRVLPGYDSAALLY